MHRIDLTATVTENRRLVIELPENILEGEYDVIVHLLYKPQPFDPTQPHRELTREEAKERMLRAGALSVAKCGVPDDYVPLTPEQRMEIGKMPPGSPPSEQLIDEDRGEY